MLYKTFYESKIGKMLLVSDGQSLVGLWFLDQKYYMYNIKEELRKKDDLDVFIKVKKCLDGYFKGKFKDFKNIQLNSKGTDFQKTVWSVLLEAPYGKTWTYTDVLKKIEKKLNKKSSVRAVASAISHNPILILIPCHRVIGKDCTLKGYAAGLKRKKYLLDLEKKNKYETVLLESKRLIIDKGNSKSSKSVYEYDLTKCTNIGGVNKLVKFNEPKDFVGNDPIKYYEECKKNKMFDWYVFLKSDNTCTSNVILEEKEDDVLEISYNTNPKYWGNNYVVEAVLEIIKYLKKLGYKKVIAHVYEGNTKSIRVLEKLGFKYVKKDLSFYKPLNKYIYDFEYQIDI